MLLTDIAMADDLNKMKNWIKKWTKDKVDIGAGEEKPHNTDTAENLRGEAAKIDEDEKLDDSMPPEKIVEHEPATVKPYKARSG